MSSLINKAKEALSKDKGDNAKSDNYGHHGSNTANKVDPRIDSDMDNRNDPTSRVGGYGTQENYGAASGGHPAQGGYSSHQQTGYGGPGPEPGYGTSTNAGPHNSNLLNKADPRVDSDRDNRNDPTSRVGGYGGQEGYGNQGANPLPSSGHNTHAQQGYGGDAGYGGRGLAAQSDIPPHGGYNAPGHSGSTNAGPHNSNLMNKADPRVDSDRDNRNDPTSRVGGYGGQEGYGNQGANPMPSSGHTAHHATTTTYSQGGYGGDAGAGYGQPQGGYAGGPGGVNEPGYGASATPGSGNTAKTAGPHNSNLMNKLDPRVDSDMDGSKTYGGNKTHQ